VCFSQVDEWVPHAPGDVIRISILRRFFGEAEEESSTEAIVSFHDMLSAVDASCHIHCDDEPPFHAQRKDLSHLTDQFCFQGPLSVYVRLYRADDAVAMVPPVLPHLMTQALLLTRRLRSEISLLQPLQRDFSSERIQRCDMGDLIANEMKYAPSIAV